MQNRTCLKSFATALAVTCSVVFGARAGTWTFDNNTITDGSWVLNVSGNVVNGAITVTGPSSGSGELDLRDMTVDGVAVTALTIGTSAFANNANITKFYANNVTGALTRTFAFSANLTQIEISGDGITGLMPVNDGFAESCTGLTSVKINAPNMTEIGKWAFLRCRNLEADIADIVSPSVRRFGDRCLCGGGTSGDDPKHIYGKLTIDYLEKLEGGTLNRTKIGEVEIRDSSDEVSTAPGDKNFGAFDSCAALTNASICLRKGDGVGNWFFCDCSGLKKVSFKGNVQYVFGGENFARKAALTTVSFEGPAPTTASLDLLLGSVAVSSPSKNCTIYASKKQNGWLELADELSADESAVAPSGCFGVYRNGSRKAWLVNQASPYDPVESGAVIVQCSPAGVGSPVPEVGQHENVEVGTAFTIPEYYVVGNDLYRSTGFTLEEYVDDAWTAVSNGTSRTWTYQTSDKMQRLTWVHELCGGTLTITKLADSTVNVSPAPVFANTYTNGTPMVITAIDMTDPVSVFHHWNGDVPAGSEATSRTLEYSFNGAQSLTANYDCRDWKGYTDDAKYYITDHNWLFEAVFDESAGLLRITNCKGGAGVLDLRNLSVNGTKVAALKIEGRSSCFSGYTLTHFYADNLAADLIGTFYGQKSLLTVEMSGDGVTALVSHDNNGVFDGCEALVDVCYDFPNLRKIGTFSFFICKGLTNDIATLVPRTVTNIGHRVFLSANNVRGCLTLDRCDYIGSCKFLVESSAS